MVEASSDGKFILSGKQLEKVGCVWNYRRRTFEITCNDGGPTICLTPAEVIELGVELVLAANQAMTQRRWQ